MLIIGGLLAMTLALALTGCGGGSDVNTVSYQPYDLGAGASPIRRENDLNPGPNGLDGAEPKPVIPDLPPPEFLVLQDLLDGIGTQADPGTELTVQYVGYLYDSEKKFASSWDEGKPFKFTLGSGEAIEGWEEGLELTEISDRRELVIPPDMTKPGTKMKDVPQGETLVYVIDVLDVQQPASKPASN